MNLETKQAAMKARNGGRPDYVAQFKVINSLALLWLADPDADVARLARKFDRPREWVEDLIDRGFPLL